MTISGIDRLESDRWRFRFSIKAGQNDLAFVHEAKFKGVVDLNQELANAYSALSEILKGLSEEASDCAANVRKSIGNR